MKEQLQARIEDLSVLPTALGNILAALQDADTDPREIARIASTEPAIATEILRAVNSAFCGLREKVSDLQRAILMLGYGRVKLLVLRWGIDRTMTRFNEPVYRRKLTEIWRHSYLVSRAVEHLLRKHTRLHRTESPTAALLHDLGKLLLLDLEVRDEFVAERVFRTGAMRMQDTVLVEEDFYGANHCQIGVRIADKLELPPLVKAVLTYHHHDLDTPEISALPGEVRQTLALIQLGDILVHDFTYQRATTSPGDVSISLAEPTMYVYRKYFSRLPDFATLKQDLHPILGEAAEFLDSILPVESDSGSPDEPPVESPGEGSTAQADAETAVVIDGRYLMLQRLGKGSMGSVYLCEDRLLGQKFAVKIISPEVQRSKHALQALLNEMRISIRLNHPGIVRVFHFDQREGSCYILLEHVDGRSLDELIGSSPERRIPERKALGIASELANALAYAHRAGVIHRDLNPRNVMLNAQGKVKLLDFGVAVCKAANEESGVGASSQAYVAGTPAYMSPEHWKGIEFVDHRSDVYSFGALLYRLISGEDPPGNKDRSFPSNNRIDARPSSPKHCSERTEEFIRCCLDPDPDSRWQDFSTVVTELARLNAPAECVHV